MPAPTATKEAVKLFHDGIKAMSIMENNGIKIDTKYLEGAIEDTDNRVKDLRAKLMNDRIWKKHWSKKSKASLTSRAQLGDILFNQMGFEYPNIEGAGFDDEEQRDKKIKYKVDEEHLTYINEPFVQDWLYMMKLAKASDTFLKGIYNEVSPDGILRSFYNLHIPITFRSSSDTPDFQNFPIRDSELGKLIRTAFVPRKRRVLIEIDFSGVEVRISYCYHKDPVMKKYLLDPSKDMHRDMTAQCYKLPPSEVTKEARYSGKNQFVFPQFYGSYYVDCARAMWNYAVKHKLKTVSGKLLIDHLKAKGIKSLGKCDPNKDPAPGTFERHVKDVEKDFWGNRFKVYDQWKRDWYAQYQKRGWIRMYTGFVVSGSYKRNQIINTPVQGAAYHCQLWSQIELQKWLNKNSMQSLLVGQIHDSLLLDATEDEYEDVIAMAVEIMTKRIREHWDWIVIPLEVEVETTKTNWHNKTKYEIS